MKTNMIFLVGLCHTAKILRWIRNIFITLAQISLSIYLPSALASLIFSEIRRFAATILVVGIVCGAVMVLLMQIFYQIAVKIIEHILKRQVKLIMSNIGTNIALTKFCRIDDAFVYVITCEGNAYQNKCVITELSNVVNAMTRAVRGHVSLHGEISSDHFLLVGKTDKER